MTTLDKSALIMIRVWARCMQREADNLNRMVAEREIKLKQLLDFDEHLRELHDSVARTVRQHLKLNGLE